MRINDILQPGTRIFLKSEWGPASDDWPALSFSKRAVGRKIRSVYTPGRDYIVYVGTTSPVNTPNPAHRSRLLSVTSIDHRTEYETWRLVPKESWEEAQHEYANRWLYSFTITKAWEITGLPFATVLVPRAYRQLGNPANFGSIVELDPTECTAIADQPIAPVLLQKQVVAIKADARARYLDASHALKGEIYRTAALITQRAAASNTSSVRQNPLREANPPYETQQMLYDLWEEQQGRCGLCQRPIPMPPRPGLLQLSPDRKDSKNTNYKKDNLHLTHLGCNLAKNQYTIDEFEEWLEVITGSILQRPQPSSDTGPEAESTTA
jgi:hypothetical protein